MAREGTPVVKTLVNILERLIPERERGRYSGDFDRLAKEFSQLELSGRQAQAAAGKGGAPTRVASGSVVIDPSYGVWIVNPLNGKSTIRLEPDGDAWFGWDLDTPAGHSLAVFSNPQGWNGETMGAGDVLLGDNSAGAANLFWDRSTGRLNFRGGTTANAYIETDGTLHAVNATLSGTLTATAGAIGGWTVNATQIKKNGIILDSASDVIYVGSGAPRIIIDGANKWIQSSFYSAGASGFFISGSTGDAEFNNLTARGILRSAVFEKDTISAVGGYLAVLDSDVLDADMSALDAATLTIEGNTTFAVGDLLRIKNGVDDEWFEVTNIGSAPTYTVTRDKAAAYGANANPAWKKGAAVVNYGASGEGGLFLESGAVPRLRIFNHAGAPWTTVTDRVVVGNVKNTFGTGANDRYGIGIGDYAGGNYLSYNAESADTFLLKVGGGDISLDSIGIGIGSELTDFPGLLTFTHTALGVPDQIPYQIGYAPDYGDGLKIGNSNYDQTSDTGNIALFLRGVGGFGSAEISLHMESALSIVRLAPNTNATAAYVLSDADHHFNFDARVGSGLYVGSLANDPPDDDIIADGGIYLGRNADPGAGNVCYNGVLKSYKNSTEYTGYAFVPLTAPLTSGRWNGNAFSTTAKTVIDLSAAFGAPAGIKAVLLFAAVRDSDSQGTDTYLILGPSNTALAGMACQPSYVNDRYGRYSITVPCNSNGDIYYQIAASGVSTFDVVLQIWGYWI